MEKGSRYCKADPDTKFPTSNPGEDIHLCIAGKTMGLLAAGHGPYHPNEPYGCGIQAYAGGLLVYRK